MEFTGWPREALGVLEHLEGDPTPSEREQVRHEREQYVRVPMLQLLHDLAERHPTYADYTVHRYATSNWWWQHQAATIRLEPNIEVGIGFDPDGLDVQGAWWFGTPEQQHRYHERGYCGTDPSSPNPTIPPAHGFTSPKRCTASKPPSSY